MQEGRRRGWPHLAAIPVAIQAAAAVAVLYPGTPVREGHAPGPAGSREDDHCGEKEEAQSIQTLEGGSGPRPDHGHRRPTFLASGSRTTRWAAAAVPIDLVHARGSVGTGVGLALINVCKESGCVLRGVHLTQGPACEQDRGLEGCTSGHLIHSYLGCHFANRKPFNPQALTLCLRKGLCAPLSLRWPHPQRYPHSQGEYEHSTL